MAFINPHADIRACRSLKWLLSWAFLVVSQGVVAQEPVTLKSLLVLANSHYPALQAARLEMKAALDDLEGSRRLYWPTVSAVVETASTTASVTTPSKFLQVEQTIWDAGSINARIAESKSISDVQTLRAAIVQEDVHLQLTNAWQNLLASKGRMDVAQQAIERLQAFQLQMLRRVQVEASPRIDLELANSRILQTEVEFTTAQNSFKQALNRIEQYSGRKDLKTRALEPGALAIIAPTAAFDESLYAADWAAVMNQHPSIGKARAEAAQSQTRLDQKKAEAWPQLYARVTKPLSTPDARFTSGPTAFLGLRYSSSAGFGNQLQAQALATRVASAEELVNGAATDLRQNLQVDLDEYVNAKLRIASLEKSVKGADLVLESYLRQFQGGKKTWQDLLNAVRELAQNEYTLADARASMQGAYYRLQIRTGQDLQ
jgi:adhesin transport system outer membrane protein